MKKRDDAIVAIAVASLLVFTAWGNATAMFVASAIACVAGLVMSRGRAFHSRLLVAMVAFAVAVVVAIAIPLV